MPKNNLPPLTESIVRAGAAPQSFARGQELYRADAISNATRQDNVLRAHCQGTMEPYYRVSATLDEAGVSVTACTCEYDFGGYCKHIIALLLTYIHKPKLFATRPSAQELLADLSRADLAALVLKLLEREPELYDWVAAMVAAPVPSATHKTARTKKVDAEIYRRQVRNVLHSLDGVRASEAYWGMGGMADGLREVVASAQKFLDAHDPDTALTILLALTEELTDSHAYEYLDDSNGELGDFANEIGLPLAEAILSVEQNAGERAQLVKQLKKWERELSDYGMEEGLELALQAAEYGWGDVPPRPAPSFARPIASSDTEDYTDDEYEDEEYDEDDEFDDEESGDAGFYVRDNIPDLTEAKLNVLARQNKMDEYLALCEKAGKHARYAGKLIELGRVMEGTNYALEHLEFADDALTLAQQLRELKKIPEALAIGERGLKLQGYKFALAQWLAPLEETQSRAAHALDAWLAAFDERPSLDIYKRLQQLGAREWNTLQPRVMNVLKKSWDKSALAQVLLYEEKWDQALALADKHAADYSVVAIVADGALTQRPEWVIHASKKQALELIARTQTKYYVHAVEWLERVKKAYAVLNQRDAWNAYLNDLKLEYKRRPALQEQLKRL